MGSEDASLPRDVAELLSSTASLLKKHSTGQRKELLESLRQVYRVVGLCRHSLGQEQLQTLHRLAMPLALTSATSMHQRTSALGTSIAAMLCTLPCTPEHYHTSLRPLLELLPPAQNHPRRSSVGIADNSGAAGIAPWILLSEADRRLVWQLHLEQEAVDAKKLRSRLLQAYADASMSPSLLLPRLLRLTMLALDSESSSSTVTALKIIEADVVQCLVQASRVSEPSTEKVLFSSLRSRNPTPVLELDGNAARDFFTVMNSSATANFSADQEMNIHCFSLMHRWLEVLYGSGRLQEINSQFKEVLVSYSSRVVSQSSLEPLQDSVIAGKGALCNPSLPDVCLLTALSILDVLSNLDGSVVQHTFNIMKKALSRSRSKSSVPLSLLILSFFLRHCQTILFDLEPAFRSFFEECLPNFYTRAVPTFQVLSFCNGHQELLLTHTSVFSSYFPNLLKLFAWFPLSNEAELLDLLPALVAPTNAVELFHSILDLPLVACAMEKTHGPGAESSKFSNEMRVLFNYLLRDQSGVTINFWQTSSTLPILLDFCKSSSATPRVRAVCERVPRLLEVFFDVIFEHAEQSLLGELLGAMVERLDQLYPLPSFQAHVNVCLVARVLDMFHCHPSLIVTEKELVCSTIGDSSHPGRAELVLSFIWAVGEFANGTLVNGGGKEVIFEYHEAIELFAFERTSFAKLGITNAANLSASPQRSYAPFDPMHGETSSAEHIIGVNGAATSPLADEHTTRLMMTVVNTLGKLASRWQSLSSRVVLCLTKIVQHREYFHASVLRWASHWLMLLKFPSIADAVARPSDCDRPLQGRRGQDETSSLPFLLHVPPTTDVDRVPLHSFEL